MDTDDFDPNDAENLPAWARRPPVPPAATPPDPNAPRPLTPEAALETAQTIVNVLKPRIGVDRTRILRVVLLVFDIDPRDLE